jgi:hypothetical protein
MNLRFLRIHSISINNIIKPTRTKKATTIGMLSVCKQFIGKDMWHIIM